MADPKRDDHQRAYQAQKAQFGLEAHSFPIMARLRSAVVALSCQLVGEDRKWLADRRNGDFDPEQTSMLVRDQDRFDPDGVSSGPSTPWRAGL